MVVKYNFPDHISGTTFNGISFTINVNGTPLNLTGATIIAVFNDGQHSFSSFNNVGITITNATLGIFTINSQMINWRKDRYRYYIQFTLSNGQVKRYIQGIWRIE